MGADDRADMAGGMQPCAAHTSGKSLRPRKERERRRGQKKKSRRIPSTLARHPAGHPHFRPPTSKGSSDHLLMYASSFCRDLPVCSPLLPLFSHPLLSASAPSGIRQGLLFHKHRTSSIERRDAPPCLLRCLLFPDLTKKKPKLKFIPSDPIALADGSSRTHLHSPLLSLNRYYRSLLVTSSTATLQHSGICDVAQRWRPNL